MVNPLRACAEIARTNLSAEDVTRVFTVLACGRVRSRNSVLALPRWLQMIEEGQYKVSAAAGRSLRPPRWILKCFTAFSCCLQDDKTVLTERSKL